MVGGVDTAPVAGRTGRPAFYDDLLLSLAEALRLWAAGAADRRSPFHGPICATVTPEGRPRARIVTLRAFDPEQPSARFHLDRRSDKFTELSANPAIALTGYDPAAKIQIRLEGRARLHLDDAVADHAWETSRPMSRVCYGETPGPGAELAAGGAYSLPEDEAAAMAGRINFCAALVMVESLDWVYLAHGGHRRARFDFAGGEVGAKWLAP